MKTSLTLKRKSRRHFLLLQGTKSFFFDLLAQKLRAQGCKTTKINFNSGDSFFYRHSNVIDYRYSIDDWAGYISDIAKIQRVTDLVVFGDSSKLHAIAIAELKKIGVNVHVFGKGYFDQNHITLERDGINGNSPLAHEPMFYMRTPTIHSDITPEALPHSGIKRALYSIAYALAAKFGNAAKFQLHTQKHSAFWLVDALLQKTLQFALGKRKYFVANIDANNSAFLRKTIASFAAHTPVNQILVINICGKAKFAKAKRIAQKTAQKHSAGTRVFLLRNANLATLVKASEGMIVFNSVDGIVALEHEKPVIALGKTNFSFAGLSNQAKLRGFWQRRTSPNPSLYGKFRNHIFARTQINGDFFSRKGMEMAASSASQVIINSANGAVGNNVSENV